MNQTFLRAVSALSLAATVAACGGGGGGGGSAPATYSVGGTITGLESAQTIVLKNNGGDTLTFQFLGDNSFSFPTRMASGAYNVTLDLAGSDKNCLIENATGNVSGANVTNVSIRCSKVFAYVVNSGEGTVTQFTTGTDGQLSEHGTVSVGDPRHVAVHPSGKYAYVAEGFARISQYTIGTDGTLAAMTPAIVSAGIAGNEIVKIAFDDQGRYAYALNGTAGRIYQYTIGANGSLTPMGTPYVGGLTNPGSIAYHSTSRSFVVAENRIGGNVTVYNTDVNGELLFNLGYAANIHAKEVSILGTNRAYVAGGTDNAILKYDIDGSGVLSAPVTTPTNASKGQAVGPNGNMFWALDTGVPNAIRPFQVGVGGALAAGADIGTGGLNTPSAIASNGSYVYVTNYNGSNVSQYRIDNPSSASGALTPLATPTVVTGMGVPSLPSSITLY